MLQSRFASVPNISIPRSRFKTPFNHSMTFEHGDIVPLDCLEVLPGDTISLNLSAMIWMSNPIRPIFGNITGHVSVFFVPMRLVWENTKQFFGENKLTSGYQSVDYKVPNVRLGRGVNCPKYNSLSHYLGKPIVETANVISEADAPLVSVLKERGYYEIYNNYYRAQQIQNPVLVTYGGNGTYPDNGATRIGSLNGNMLDFTSPLMKTNKEFDYFTAATLYPQYGPAVTLPLGSFAPVITSPVTELADVDDSVINHAKGANPYLQWISTGQVPQLVRGGLAASDSSKFIGITDYYTGVRGVDSSGTTVPAIPANLVADLSNATAATINSLRYAFAVQKFLERSNFGSRYFEMLQVHYGVSSPDASLQIPQRIGHFDFAINVSTVLSTAGATDDDTSALGMPGAVSSTAVKERFLFTHAFTEPGYLYVLLSTTHERSYTQGVLREDMKINRYDIYTPEFANLGDQEVKNCEIFLGADGKNNDVFGYQEHWAEYRFRPHRVSGLLDPQAANSLDFWVLTEDFANRPSLSPEFIVEDRTNLARCLVTGETGPDYVGDFFMPYICTREMPLFTIPGLIDHFGSY